MNRFFGQQTLNGEWHALLPRYVLVSERVTGRRVLDIGCGSGIGASLLHELGATYVNAIDQRPAVLNVAQSRSEKEGLHFEVMFWEDLNFEDDSFDIVLCLDPASPVTDPSLLQEVRRVLRAGGEYICAIERRMVDGLESLLPRYGYPNAAEHVDIYSNRDYVPQLGEIKRFFPYISSLIQRPRLSYNFSNDENTDLDRTLDVDTRFCDPNHDPGSVEIWFCSDQLIQSVPEKVVQLPYSEIVNRLSEVANHVNIHSVIDRIDGHASTVDELFDEIVDESSLNLGGFGGFEEPTLASDLQATRFQQGTAYRQGEGNFIESEFDTIRALDHFHHDNDFEDRIDTNAFFDPIDRQHIRSNDELKDALEAEIAEACASKDAEIQHLKEMFDHLTSVVERQSAMIQNFLHQSPDLALQDPAAGTFQMQPPPEEVFRHTGNFNLSGQLDPSAFTPEVLEQQDSQANQELQVDATFEKQPTIEHPRKEIPKANPEKVEQLAATLTPSELESPPAAASEAPEEESQESPQGTGNKEESTESQAEKPEGE